MKQGDIIIDLFIRGGEGYEKNSDLCHMHIACDIMFIHLSDDDGTG
jgi:hypothetical protein